MSTDSLAGLLGQAAPHQTPHHVFPVQERDAQPGEALQDIDVHRCPLYFQSSRVERGGVTSSRQSKANACCLPDTQRRSTAILPPFHPSRFVLLLLRCSHACVHT